MSTKLIYKRIHFDRGDEAWQRLNDGAYEPPDGWRVHSMAITTAMDYYAGRVHLLLEATVNVGEPYR